MEAEKQRVLLELLVSSPKLFSLCLPIIKHEYFEPKLQGTVKFITEYFNEYRGVPSIDIIKAETSYSLIKHDVTKDMMKWASNEIEKFCRVEAMKIILLDAPRLLSSQNDSVITEAWKKASQISLINDLGDDYFATIDERVEHLCTDSEIMSTGIDKLDEALQPRRQELFMVSGNSGGGKSLTLNNICFNTACLGYNSLYISIEMTSKRIGQRIDAIITGINPKQYNQNKDEVLIKLKQFSQNNPNLGKIHIVRLKPQIDANGLRSYIDEYISATGINPDHIFVDYMGRMSCIDKTIKEAHIKDERIMDELREIGVDYDAVMWTGSQQTRGAVKTKVEDLGQDNLAGGMAKINPCDGAFACVFNDVMKFAGEIAYKITKARNSELTGALVFCDWFTTSMRIGNREKNVSKLNGTAKDRLTKELEDISTMDKKPENSGKPMTFQSLLESDYD